MNSLIQIDDMIMSDMCWGLWRPIATSISKCNTKSFVVSNSSSSCSKRLLVCQFEFVLWSMTVVIGLGSVMGWGPGWCPITVSGHRLEIYSSYGPPYGAHVFTWSTQPRSNRFYYSLTQHSPDSAQWSSMRRVKLSLLTN